MISRVIVTGGSGKAGRHVISALLNRGHQVLNLDLNPLSGDLGNQVHTIKVDLTDSGQVFSALTSPFKLTQPFREPLLQPPSAVVHLAGYARNMLAPANETFTANVTSTYNIIEAAAKLGVSKIILASSVCVYGPTFAHGHIDFDSFPIDEQCDPNPMDDYSLSKLCAERVARGYARKYGIDIYCLRIGAVIGPAEYEEQFASYRNHPEDWNVHGWSYTDARDLGLMVHCCLEKKGLGFQIFNATNDEITNDCESTTEFLQRVAPSTPFTRTMSEREAPMSNKKMKDMLEFREEYNLRNVLDENLRKK